MSWFLLSSFPSLLSSFSCNVQPCTTEKQNNAIQPAGKALQIYRQQPGNRAREEELRGRRRAQQDMAAEKA